jgi:hypothetical protein
MGGVLPDYLKGDYVKLYTRYDDVVYEKCEIKDTLSKIKEYAKVFDSIAISFGLRLFPTTAYSNIVKENSKETGNLVFLKKLKGSKTWTIVDGKLNFNNNRISDTGLFILSAKDLLETKSTNFNYFLHELVDKGKLRYQYIPYWVTTNKVDKNSRGDDNGK